jgi:acetyl-CoA carboxylase biotin carboxyl carrier protein
MPGDPPLVKVGDKVKSGALLGVVDTMRVRALMSGTIAEIMASDGAMVAAGQPLFRIRKS